MSTLIRSFTIEFSATATDRSTSIVYQNDSATIVVSGADGVASGELTLRPITDPTTAAYEVSGTVSGSEVTFVLPTSERNDFESAIQLVDTSGSVLTCHAGLLLIR